MTFAQIQADMRDIAVYFRRKTTINVEEWWVAEKCRNSWVYYLSAVAVCVISIAFKIHLGYLFLELWSGELQY